MRYATRPGPSNKTGEWVSQSKQVLPPLEPERSPWKIPKYLLSCEEHRLTSKHGDG